MATRQQAEALRYFKSFADDWELKARSAADTRVNVIQQRNGYVLSVLARRPETRRLLDIGCGTGDLVCEAARRGVTAVGVDFAEEMIAIAEGKARAAGLSNVSFTCASIFELDLAEGEYDLIAANGLIEYLSHVELEQLLSLSHRALSRKGSLVVGSRNRLFNLSSLNGYTTAELEGGCVTQLLEEAVALASDAPLAALLDMEPAPLQPAYTAHGHTGIDVRTRYQYTPVQLMKMLHRKGFDPQELFPVHIHGVPPAFKGTQPAVHANVSNLLQRYAGEHRSLVPFASSFMIHATTP